MLIYYILIVYLHLIWVDIPCDTWISKCIDQQHLQNEWAHERFWNLSNDCVWMHTGHSKVTWATFFPFPDLIRELTSKFEALSRYLSAISSVVHLCSCSSTFASEGVILSALLSFSTNSLSNFSTSSTVRQSNTKNSGSVFFGSTLSISSSSKNKRKF
jgi:hypothetical protein